MRDLVDRYLRKRLSRRAFVRHLADGGFSVAAVTSILESLAPLARAQAPAATPANAASGGRVVRGTGGDLLVEQLRAAGVRFVFNCNSSGTYPVFDALLGRSDMHVIQVLQEAQLVAIAQGYTLAGGEVAFTLCDGAGFPSTINNMYNAWKDRTPMVIASQRAPTGVHGGRDASEEWDDFLSPAASFTRWRWSVGTGERIPEITRRAFKIAATAPEGPVALAFPDDVLAAGELQATILDRDKFLLRPTIKPDPRLIEEAARLLVEATRPLLIVGPEVTRSGAKAEVIRLAENLSLPVAQTEWLFDEFPTDHPLFVGDGIWSSGRRVDVDLVFALGTRIGHHGARSVDDLRIVHASVDPEMIGKVVPAEVGIVGDAREVAADLSLAVESQVSTARLKQIREQRLSAIQPISQSWRDERARSARERWNLSPLSWERVAGELNLHLDKDAIIVPELSENSFLGRRENTAMSQFDFAPGGRSRIGRTTGSALGWGVGAAVGVKLAQPDRQVVALQGDGSFLFNQAETLWTMARHDIPVIVVVFNNRSYNGPRNRVLRGKGKQAQAGKEMTSYLGAPDVDFAKLAASFGVAGEAVRAAEQLAPAIRRAIHTTRDGRPYLIDAVVCRTGTGADSTWFPEYSLAAMRTRKV
jgi:thiamine pyrophosphate-dependent acetolactate synthase large subunit-like protein